MSRIPRSLAELRAMPAPKPSVIVEALEDMPRHKIAKGDQFTSHPYVMDPSDKWTLVARVSDGWNPECNAYRSEVKVIKRL